MAKDLFKFMQPEKPVEQKPQVVSQAPVAQTRLIPAKTIETVKSQEQPKKIIPGPGSQPKYEIKQEELQTQRLVVFNTYKSAIKEAKGTALAGLLRDYKEWIDQEIISDTGEIIIQFLPLDDEVEDDVQEQVG